MIEKPFYVYLLSRPNGEPFYVGMGSGDRLLQHEKRARKDKSRKASIIQSIRSQGLTVGRKIVEHFATDAEAKCFEIRLISAIGRSDLGTGTLANHTNGGDGVTGWSDEMRQAHGPATSAGMSSPDVRDACRSHMARLRAIPEWAVARAAELKEYWKKPEHRAAQSARIKRHFSDAQVRAAHSARQKRALSDPAVREKMRIAKLGKPQDRAVVEKRAAALRKPRRPGTGASISAGKRAAVLRRLTDHNHIMSFD